LPPTLTLAFASLQARLCKREHFVFKHTFH